MFHFGVLGFSRSSLSYSLHLHQFLHGGGSIGCDCVQSLVAEQMVCRTIRFLGQHFCSEGLELNKDGCTQIGFLLLKTQRPKKGKRGMEGGVLQYNNDDDDEIYVCICAFVHITCYVCKRCACFVFICVLIDVCICEYIHVSVYTCFSI